MDPHTPTPTKMESNDFPALFIQRRPSASNHLSHIPLYNLLTLPPTPTPQEMAGPVRSAATDTRMAIQPPRPPNAWILYRSDKLRELPPTGPGTPRRAQAEVSKLISNMWKNESDYVRAEYERRADAKKAEHQALYPGYRFQPMKKEEKERIREEKRLEKERDRAQTRRGRARPAPYATGFIPPPIPQPSIPYYHPEVRYGPAGPSPPLSAASSPNDASPYPESQQGPDEQPVTQSTHASPHPESYASATDTVTFPPVSAPLYKDPILPSQSSQLPPTSRPEGSHLSLPGPSQWQSQHQAGPHKDLTQMPAPIWPSYDPQHLDDPISQDYVSFSIQPLGMQSANSWMSGISDNATFDESIQALLSATGDPSIFQLSNFDPESLALHPSGEIEVSMGQISFPFEPQPHFSPSDFDNFDFGALAGPSSLPMDSTNPGSSSAELPNDLTAFFQNDPVADTSTSQHSDYSNYNADEFLNFDEVPSDIAPFQPASQPHSQSMSLIDQREAEPAPTPPGPYVPPSGAAFSSTRRVGASWKSAFATPDPSLDHSPPRSWGVPAS